MRIYKVISATLSLAILAGCSSSSPSSANGGSGDPGPGGGAADGGTSADGGSKDSREDGGVADGLSATASSSLFMAPGASATLTVTIARSGGWDADVALTAKGLPVGITADAATIAKGTTSTDVTFHASATATATALPLSIDASGGGLDATATFALSIGRQSIDTSFGTGGVVFMQPDIDFTDFVAQADGKIVASAGLQTGHDYGIAPALVRFDVDGKIDTSFGTSGQILFDLATSSPAGLALQSDGKPLLSFGASLSNAGTPRVSVVRTLTNGKLDNAFGTGGYATIDFGMCSSLSGLSSIAIQSDGRILVGAALGCTSGATAFTEGVVARLTASGASDPTFGSGGKLLLIATTGSSTGVGHLVPTPDALYILGTHYYNKSGQGFVTEGTIAKYDVDGTAIDSSFANSGVFTRPGSFAVQTTTLSCLVPETGTGLVWGQDGGGVFGRLTAAGAIDGSFGDGSGGTGVVGVTETYSGDWDADPLTDLALGSGNRLFLAQSNIPRRAVELWSYSAAGIRDLSFAGTAGRILVPVGSTPAVKRVRVGGDGRVVVLTGLASNPGEPAAALLRFFP